VNADWRNGVRRSDFFRSLRWTVYADLAQIQIVAYAFQLQHALTLWVNIRTAKFHNGANMPLISYTAATNCQHAYDWRYFRSGETADTLAALAMEKTAPLRSTTPVSAATTGTNRLDSTFSICYNWWSTPMLELRWVTKTFIAQLVALLLAGRFGLSSPKPFLQVSGGEILEWVTTATSWNSEIILQRAKSHYIEVNSSLYWCSG